MKTFIGNVKFASFHKKLSISFALGTLDGVLVLLPYLSNATDSTNSLSDAKMALAKALNNTNNCGSSGSNEALLKVVNGTENLAQAFSALTQVVKNQTNDDGQFKLLTGDISQLTDEIKKSADALEGLSEVIQNLTKHIDTESLDGVDKLVASQKNLTKSSTEFNQVFSSLNPVPSKLLLKVGSLLTGFTNSIHNLAVSYEAETQATSAAQKRCNVSTGMPKALSDFAEIANTIYENLKLL